MTLDRTHALDFLHQDSDLLEQTLAMFSDTVRTLKSTLEQAIHAGAGEAGAAAWNAVYKALHGALPIFLIVGSARLKEAVQQLHDALAAQDLDKAAALGPLVAPLLNRMIQEMAEPAAPAAPSASG